MWLIFVNTVIMLHLPRDQLNDSQRLRNILCHRVSNLIDIVGVAARFAGGLHSHRSTISLQSGVRDCLQWTPPAVIIKSKVKVCFDVIVVLRV
jgi:hypothetical protein